MLGKLSDACFSHLGLSKLNRPQLLGIAEMQKVVICEITVVDNQPMQTKPRWVLSGRFVDKLSMACEYALMVTASEPPYEPQRLPLRLRFSRAASDLLLTSEVFHVSEILESSALKKASKFNDQRNYR